MSNTDNLTEHRESHLGSTWYEEGSTTEGMNHECSKFIIVCDKAHVQILCETDTTGSVYLKFKRLDTADEETLITSPYRKPQESRIMTFLMLLQETVWKCSCGDNLNSNRRYFHNALSDSGHCIGKTMRILGRASLWETMLEPRWLFQLAFHSPKSLEVILQTQHWDSECLNTGPEAEFLSHF